ncbi:MAG: FecR family protein [Parcubacteria group bacterium]
MIAERSQTDIDREASEWLARRRMTRLTASEEAAFAAWSADPKNAATFAQMSRTLDDIASLSSLAELEPLEPAHRRPMPRRNVPLMRKAAAAGIGAAAAAVVAVAVIPTVDRPDLQAATRVGEVRTLILPDGSHVTLGAKSSITFNDEHGVRRVRLTSGEAFFDVVHDAAHPFEVEARGAVIRDIGTKFDVRRGAGGVEVAVLEGSVEVRERALTPAGPRTLLAGQRVVATQTRLGPVAVPLSRVGEVTAAPPSAGEWRSGQLAYDDTRLADVVADLNRYYGPGVKLEGGAGAERLAASFKVGEIDKFLTELPTVAPVTVVRDASGAVTISPRQGGPQPG